MDIHVSICLNVGEFCGVGDHGSTAASQVFELSQAARVYR